MKLLWFALDKIKSRCYLIKEFFHPEMNVSKKWFSFNSDKSGEVVDYNFPKLIWVYWESEEKSHLVELCVDIIKARFPGYKINLLNENNINDYVPILDLPKGLSLAHKSDYIRLKLLYDYGGIWIDATILLTKTIDWIIDAMKGHSVFLFYSDECTSLANKPITENWFIIADRKSVFIGDWMQEIERCFISENSDTYYEFILDENDVIQNIPNIAYLKTYVAASYVLSKRNYDILCLNSGSTGHYYNYRYISNSFLIAISLCMRPATSIYVPEIIKLTSKTRFWLELFIKWRIFTNRSLIGDLWRNYSRYK